MALYSIRLDEASELALIAAARSRKVTRAVILREAIAEYGKSAGRAGSPAPQFASLIGVIENGPGNLSERTGEAFAGIVAAKKHRRAKQIRRKAATAPAAQPVQARRKAH
jgi:hypothetical protein